MNLNQTALVDWQFDVYSFIDQLTVSEFHIYHYLISNVLLHEIFKATLGGILLSKGNCKLEN